MQPMRNGVGVLAMPGRPRSRCSGAADTGLRLGDTRPFLLPRKPPSRSRGRCSTGYQEGTAQSGCGSGSTGAVGGAPIPECWADDRKVLNGIYCWFARAGPGPTSRSATARRRPAPTGSGAGPRPAFGIASSRTSGSKAVADRKQAGGLTGLPIPIISKSGNSLLHKHG